jgi:hypothetical protein
MRRTPVRGLAATLIVTAACFLTFHASGRVRADSADAWEMLDQDEGITVYRREVPGRDVYAFRGDIVIDAHVSEIIGVMMDVSKHTEWMYKCIDSRILKQVDEQHAIGYTRVDAPWPISDRDAVIDTKVTYSDGGRRVRMDFHGIDGRDMLAVPDDVVRMPRLDGFYDLHEYAPGKTKIRYEAISDIGGKVPTWMANLAARDLPHLTLARLRDRVMATLKR